MSLPLTSHPALGWRGLSWSLGDLLTPRRGCQRLCRPSLIQASAWDARHFILESNCESERWSATPTCETVTAGSGADGIVGVDGVFRKVDLSDLDPAVHAVQFDDIEGRGHIEYKPTSTVLVEVRDFDAERIAEAEAGDDREKQKKLKMIMRTVKAPRPPERISDFAPYRHYVDHWETAAPPPPTPEQIQQALAGAVQLHLDEEARKLGYDNISTAVTYADEPAVPKFQAEGLAFREWRSRVWARCYELLGEVQAGTRAIPTEDELLAELPALELPAGTVPLTG